jgi:hypothetical protein
MGRKSKFTPKTVEAILESISIGAYYIDAAKAARISDQTLLNWLAEGRAARAAAEVGDVLDKNAEDKLDFLEKFEQAEAQCAIDMQMLVYNEAQRNVEKAQWWLERRRPDQFRPPNVRSEITGKDGNAMEIVIRYADANPNAT